MVARKRDDVEALEHALGHRFDDPDLLRRALTHASAQGDTSYERLEFLGDRVLNLVIADALIVRHPKEREGALALRLNALVRKETCAEVAERIDLGAFLRMAKSEARSGGRRKRALLGDAMEAVIAAVYRDGGLMAARDSILDLWADRLDAQDEAPQDAKTRLQEWAQARNLELPRYRVTDRDGPDHEPRFTVEVTLGGDREASRTGSSKRAAEQDAAQALLDRLETE